jgi:ferredoxin
VRLQVNRDLCLSTALCTGLAPEVLDMDEAGLLVILDETPSDALRADVLEAVRACPFQALIVSES